MPGNAHRKIRAGIEAGQRTDAALAGKGRLPLAFQLEAQRRYAVIADNQRPLTLRRKMEKT